METIFTKNEIKDSISEFWKRMGKEDIEIKDISIENGKIGDSFNCKCNPYGNFDSYDFKLEKVNRVGKLIVRR